MPVVLLEGVLRQNLVFHREEADIKFLEECISKGMEDLCIGSLEDRHSNKVPIGIPDLGVQVDLEVHLLDNPHLKEIIVKEMKIGPCKGLD